MSWPLAAENRLGSGGDDNAQESIRAVNLVALYPEHVGGGKVPEYENCTWLMPTNNFKPRLHIVYG